MYFISIEGIFSCMKMLRQYLMNSIGEQKRICNESFKFRMKHNVWKTKEISLLNWVLINYGTSHDKSLDSFVRI